MAPRKKKKETVPAVKLGKNKASPAVKLGKKLPPQRKGSENRRVADDSTPNVTGETVTVYNKLNNDATFSSSVSKVPLPVHNSNGRRLRDPIKSKPKPPHPHKALFAKAKAFHILKQQVLAPYVARLLLERRFADIAENLENEATLFETPRKNTDDDEIGGSDSVW